MFGSCREDERMRGCIEGAESAFVSSWGRVDPL